MAAGGLVSADEVAGSGRMVLSVPWVVIGWDSTPSILAVVGRVTASSVRPRCFGSWPQGWHPPDHGEHPVY